MFGKLLLTLAMVLACNHLFSSETVDIARPPLRTDAREKKSVTLIHSAGIEEFLDRRGIDIFREWELCLSRYTVHQQEFFLDQKILPSEFFASLQSLERKIIVAFSQARRIPLSLLLKRLTNKPTGPLVSITRFFQADEEEKYVQECKESEPESIYLALGKGVAAYVCKQYLNKRLRANDPSVLSAPLTPIALYTKNPGILCIVSVPGVTQDDHLFISYDVKEPASSLSTRINISYIISRCLYLFLLYLLIWKIPTAPQVRPLDDVCLVGTSFCNKNSCYQQLGLSIFAGKDTVIKKYRDLARTMHPDKNSAADAHEKFIALNQAYKICLEKTEE